ncbi:MAG: sugar ABC transporter substrate-binding protein [Anaerolineae bacterium]|nr:MAG: sugar ABC transporter substrate-binding protein [Anaerolineae bacterium]
MSKKLLSLLSLLVVFATLLAACGSPAAPTAAPSGGGDTAPAQPAGKVTLRVLVHQNPPMVAFMEEFNKKFQEKHPNIVVDMSVVNANDLSTVSQTRLSANDIDVLDIFGFSNAAQPYMKQVDPPNWQQLIEAGLLMDLTGQDFLKYYDESALKDAGSYNGKVYAVNLGRVSYSGIYYNKKLFEQYNLKVPTTWSELVTACETFKAAGIPCMTAGGKDGWPIFVGAYGLIGSMYPDQAALVEGLWTGKIKWNDEKSLEMWQKMQVYARDMMEEGASGIAGDAAPGRFASGAVAMFPGGTWYAPAIEAAQPDFDWGYIPFPGSDNPEDNKYLFGKYDQGWAIAANTPNKEAALLYLAEFSDPANYQAFVNAVGFIPTQPTAQLNTKIGAEVAPYLANFRVGYEQYWVAPKGAGQFANPWASYFKPFGTDDDPKALADKVQADLQAGLDAVNK